eukprot:913522-Prorocentrum_minimum.AAC.1
MKSWRFLVLNWGGSEGFGEVRRGSEGFGGVRRGSEGFGRSIERQWIYRFDSRDNMRHHYQSVRHRPSSCPSDLRSG